MTQVFRSKVDAWLMAIMLAAVALIAVSIVSAWQDARPGAVAVSVVGAVAAGLVLWVLGATDYRVADGVLRIRSGPFRWRVPVAQITAVERTRSPLSSPALSLNRLRIRYGAGQVVMVSPRDGEAFLRALGHEPVGVDPIARG